MERGIVIAALVIGIILPGAVPAHSIPVPFAHHKFPRFSDTNKTQHSKFLNKRGRCIGTDGKMNGKIYVVKTVLDSFDNKPNVGADGISRWIKRATFRYIREHSGDTTAFSDRAGINVYNNFQEIISDQKVRDSMFNIVRRGDNGKGKTDTANNREYGGIVDVADDGSLIVKEAMPGPVNDPTKDDYAVMQVTPNSKTRYEFHSHPSGWKNKSLIEASFFHQAPSLTDISGVGSLTGYIFGRHDGFVYMYTCHGVTAAIAAKYFIKSRGRIKVSAGRPFQKTGYCP